MTAHTWARDEDGEIKSIEGQDPHSPMYYCTVCEDYECSLCPPTECGGPLPPLTLEEMRKYRDQAQERVDHWDAEIAKATEETE